MSDPFTAAKAFLATETLSHFLNAAEPKPLATLNKSSSEVVDALELLAAHNALSAPVVDSDGAYVGVTSVGDMLKAFMHDLEKALGHSWLEGLENVTAGHLETIGSDLLGKPVTDVLHDVDLWLKGDAQTTLATVISEGFRIQDSRPHHRIFVIEPEKGKGPSAVVTQSDVVKLLWQHKSDALAPVVGRSLEDLEAYVGSVFTVSTTTTALEAFHHMAIDHKSGVGIVAPDGRLVGNLSASDIRYLTTPAAFGQLLLPAHEWVLAQHSAQSKGKSARSSLERPSLVQTLTPSSTLAELLDLLVQTHLHRVYVVDAEGAPLSIITLTDVLRLVTRVPVVPAVAPAAVAASTDGEGDDMVEA